MAVYHHVGFGFEVFVYIFLGVAVLMVHPVLAVGDPQQLEWGTANGEGDFVAGSAKPRSYMLVSMGILAWIKGSKLMPGFSFFLCIVLF